MRAALAGGTGFIGGHLIRALLAAGHEVRALCRPSRRPVEVRAGLTWIEGRWGQVPPALFEGAEAAVNAVGLLQARGDATFEAVHVRGAQDFFECAGQGGARLLQLSALGASEDAATAFLRTKGAADAWLLRHHPTALILRPSVVYGPGDLSTAYLARLARLPLTPLPAGGRMRLQPLFVGDLAEAVVRALERGVYPAGIRELGGPEALTLREMVAALGARRMAAVPAPLMELAARMGGWAGLPLLNPEAWAMLQAGNTCDPAPLKELLGREAVAFGRGVGLRKAAG